MISFCELVFDYLWWTDYFNWKINILILLISLIRLLLVYNQQMQTYLLSDHQRILINFMYVTNIVLYELNTAIIY